MSQTVFVETFQWVAMLNPRDQWHDHALRAWRSLGTAQIVTTEEVLAEVLTFLSREGPRMRRRAAAFVRETLEDEGITVVSQTRSLFLTALELYEARADKEYSFPDCVSMCVMRDEGCPALTASVRYLLVSPPPDQACSNRAADWKAHPA